MTGVFVECAKDLPQAAGKIPWFSGVGAKTFFRFHDFSTTNDLTQGCLAVNNGVSALVQRGKSSDYFKVGIWAGQV